MFWGSGGWAGGNCDRAAPGGGGGGAHIESGGAKDERLNKAAFYEGRLFEGHQFLERPVG